MVEWVVSKTGLRVPDGDRVISLNAPEWHDHDTRGRSYPAGTAITGSVTGLTISKPATLTTRAGRHVRSDSPTRTGLPAGEYRFSFPALRCDGAARPGNVVVEPDAGADIRFAGPGEVHEGGESISVSFPDRTPIAIGFRRERPADEPIVVPKTPTGVAKALTHLSSALRTTGPDRSHPAFRGHPPLVEFGDDVEVPGAVRAATPDTGLLLSVPESIETLLVAAPLAYYLGARIEIEEGAAPTLSAPGTGFERRFRRMPAFQYDVAAVLRRVFLLDCLSRTIDPGEVTPAGGSPLDRLGVRLDGLEEATLAERLGRYCEVPSTRIRPELPEWHLSTYVDPVAENARSLPYLLNDLSLVYLPSASELDGKGLLRRSLDDFYRAEEVASVDRLEPELHAGRAHGWLAPGTPIDVFKSSHSAYEHRLEYDTSEPPLDVTVVFNDPEMGGEHSRVAEIYRERAVDLPANVTVRENLTREELREVFETPNDFVHFIGHCDVAGLRCPDGSFPTGSLETCRTRTFFLNACGSYHEGIGLVEAGSVAGAVTLTAVLNDHAATVGTAFARLLIYGFDIERAIQLARRRIMMGKDYAVVGDGTHTLAVDERGPPPVAWLEQRGDRFHLTHEVAATGTTGGTYRVPSGGDDRAYLYGVNTDVELTRSALRSFLDGTSLPVIYNGDFHWSTELAAQFES